MHKIVTHYLADFVVLIKDFIGPEVPGYTFLYVSCRATDVTEMVGTRIVLFREYYILIRIFELSCFPVNVSERAI